MSYADMRRHLEAGGRIILDGGTGTELERRGVAMDPEAWCGAASLSSRETLEAVHRDYIDAGAQVITANTYASSRLMLEPAGFGAQFEAINRSAVDAALQARRASGRDDVLVAGSLSQMAPMARGTARPDDARAPSLDQMAAAFHELAALLRDAGCDLLLLEMLFYPERIALVLDAALATGLPVWVGFSARAGEHGEVLSFAPERSIPFRELLTALDGRDVDAVGVMHTPANLIGEALAAVREAWSGPTLAYPDSGYFRMPNWQFEAVISPQDLCAVARGWLDEGCQIVGGCCGLSPEHIAALARLRAEIDADAADPDAPSGRR